MAKHLYYLLGFSFRKSSRNGRLKLHWFVNNAGLQCIHYCNHLLHQAIQPRNSDYKRKYPLQFLLVDLLSFHIGELKRTMLRLHLLESTVVDAFTLRCSADISEQFRLLCGQNTFIDKLQRINEVLPRHWRKSLFWRIWGPYNGI